VLLDRWAGGDARIPDAKHATAARWLAGARSAYRAGVYRPAVRLAARALEEVAEAGDAERWAVVAWCYPPAYDSLFAAYPETDTSGVDRALLQAIAWKESRFDPGARSRADAAGMLQLQRATANDVARWWREPAPSDAALADPAVNLKYGARYLERQLGRFPGNVPLALAAYNAGPSVARRWTRLRAIGGDALACEEIDFPETEDYVKTVLAVRQAYRELKPVTSRAR
jgi:soluble lytic murein transglycosylase